MTSWYLMGGGGRLHKVFIASRFICYITYREFCSKTSSRWPETRTLQIDYLEYDILTLNLLDSRDWNRWFPETIWEPELISEPIFFNPRNRNRKLLNKLQTFSVLLGIGFIQINTSVYFPYKYFFSFIF